MRVLFLDQYSDPGGAQRMLLDLLCAVRKRGWQAAVGLPGEGPLREQVRALGFEAVPLRCSAYSPRRKSAAEMVRFAAEMPGLARQIRELARRFRPEVVYINGPRLLPAAALAGLDPPVLFHAHIRIGQRAGRLLAGLALRRLDPTVLAVCRMVADSWRPFAGKERLSVVYNGVSGPHNPNRGPRQGPPVVACIGRIAPEKGQMEFLAAAERIHAALPECRFRICGAPLFSDSAAQAYERKVRAAASELPAEFTGWVQDVYAALADVDLLLAPSVWEEPNPRVILEAFAAGVPVIAFRAGGVPEIIDDGRNGFLCDDADQMARLAIDLLRDGRARLAAVSAAARQDWACKFTLERWQQQVLAAVEAARSSR